MVDDFFDDFAQAEQPFAMSDKLETYLSTLVKRYKKEGKRKEATIILNAQVRPVFGYISDRWDGGTYGHMLTLEIPADLHVELVDDKEDIEKQIAEDLNAINGIKNEYIAEVIIDVETLKNQDWRSEIEEGSQSRYLVDQTSQERIWGTSGFRVFLSHKARVKQETALLKDYLSNFGISAFVAHEDIEPTREWQTEIERALATMDALVALLTEDFHDSYWTDQEVGFAFGRGVPIVPVSLGLHPYGFIGKYQAAMCTWESAGKKIVELLINNERMLESYIRAIRDCSSYDQGNLLAEAFDHINKMTSEQADTIVASFNANSQLQYAWGFNGERSGTYGNGVLPHLRRWTGQDYAWKANRQLIRNENP